MILRFIFILTLVFAIGSLTHISRQDPGSVEVVWQGYSVSTSASFLVSGFLVVILLGFYGGQFWYLLKNVPFRLERWRQRKGQLEGVTAYLQGVEALTAGEISQANKLAAKTVRLLPESSLGQLLTAQVFELAGKETKAQGAYLALSHHKDMSFTGTKGLLQQAVNQGNWISALDFSEKLYAQKPKNAWVVEQLFESRMYGRNIEGALELVPALHRLVVFDPETVDFYEASLRLEKANQLQNESPKQSLNEVEKALKVCPNHLPALRELVKYWQQEERSDKLEKLLTRFWVMCPSDRVGKKWVKVVDERTPRKLLKKAQSLIQGKDNEATTLLLMSRVYLQQKSYTEARRELLSLLDISPCKQVYQLLAEIDEELNPNSVEIKVWRDKAMLSEELILPSSDYMIEYEKWRSTYFSAVEVLEASTVSGILASPSGR